MVNAQEWLESQEEYNTKEKREKAQRLVISEQLTGTLDLIDFTHREFQIMNFSSSWWKTIWDKKYRKL